MQLAQNSEVWPDSLCGHVGGRLQPDSIAHEERSQDVLGVAEQERGVTRVLQDHERHGQPDGVLADVGEAWEVEGLPDSARATLPALYAYLDRHWDHIDYAQYKALGLPSGSGMVESACTWLIQQHCKGVSGSRLRQDSWVSVRYAEEWHATKSAVAFQRTDRQGMVGHKPADVYLLL